MYIGRRILDENELYKDLSTFSFGAPRPPSPSPSYDADVEQDDVVSPLDPTPRPSLSVASRLSRRISDASHNTFGLPVIHRPVSTAASSPLDLSSDDDFDSLTRDTEETSLDDDPVYPRRASLPIPIPAPDIDPDAAIATTRRPSRSLDDDLRAPASPAIEPKSEPATRPDWPPLHQNPLNNVYQELGLNLEYVLGAGGAAGRRSSDAVSYVQAQQRRSSQGAFAWGWNAAGRRPSAGTVVDDSFNRHVRKWNPGHVGNWSFKCEEADAKPSRPPDLAPAAPLDALRVPEDRAKAKAAARHKPESGMVPGSQEIWRCEVVGRFKVDRQTSQPDPAKLPHQRLNLRHIFDPYSRANTRGGPSVIIHKHSRAFAFSIYRAHSLSSRHRTRPGILLAPKRVQEQFTSTKTTSKLITHGLLEDQVASSAASKDGRDDKLDAADAKGANSQTSSGGSYSTASTSVDPPVAHTYPPAPAVVPKDASPELARVRAHTSTRSLAGTSLSVSDQSTVHELHGRRSLKSLATHRDSFDLERPSRTPHAETYATLDSSLIEYVRANADNRLPEPDPNPSFFRRFLRPGPRAAVQPPNYPAGPTSASLEGQYKAPWLSLVGRAKQEETDRVIHNLNNSFMGVGLLPANSSKPRRARGTRPKKAENVDVLEQVPDESLYMLLPLWPGETDPSYARHGASEDHADVPLEERQYLLVYYVAFDQPIEKAQGRPRPQTAASREPAATPDGRGILLSPFRAVARVVGYGELRGSGVRLPSDGLSMVGPLWEAAQHVPSLSGGEQQLFVIATCLGRDHVEIVPEGLVKMGLCLPVPEHQADPDAGEGEEDAVLSPIGRAAVEMAWAGCMALTSFGPA